MRNLHLTSEEYRQRKNEKQKLYKLSPKGKLTQKRYYSSNAKANSSRKWQNKNLEKHNCHTKLYMAIKKGILKRGNCIFCDKPNGYGHHDDYTRPLNVIWVCNKHHPILHKLGGE